MDWDVMNMLGGAYEIPVTYWTMGSEPRKALLGSYCSFVHATKLFQAIAIAPRHNIDGQPGQGQGDRPC